jgi:hypothetical protein
MHADSFSSPQSYEKKGVSPYNSAMRRAATMKDEVQTGKMKTVSSVRLSSVNQFAKQMAGPSSNAKQMAGPFSKKFYPLTVACYRSKATKGTITYNRSTGGSV